jgi:hypothetical protein
LKHFTKHDLLFRHWILPQMKQRHWTTKETASRHALKVSVTPQRCLSLKTQSEWQFSPESRRPPAARNDTTRRPWALLPGLAGVCCKGTDGVCHYCIRFSRHSWRAIYYLCYNGYAFLLRIQGLPGLTPKPTTSTELLKFLLRVSRGRLTAAQLAAFGDRHSHRQLATVLGTALQALYLFTRATNTTYSCLVAVTEGAGNQRAEENNGTEERNGGVWRDKGPSTPSGPCPANAALHLPVPQNGRAFLEKLPSSTEVD